jgi:hypothetical protein
MDVQHWLPQDGFLRKTGLKPRKYYIPKGTRKVADMQIVLLQTPDSRLHII